MINMLSNISTLCRGHGDGFMKAIKKSAHDKQRIAELKCINPQFDSSKYPNEWLCFFEYGILKGYTIEYIEEKARLLNYNFKHFKLVDYGTCKSMGEYDIEKSEIIGNYFDNEELIKHIQK